MDLDQLIRNTALRASRLLLVAAVMLAAPWAVSAQPAGKGKAAAGDKKAGDSPSDGDGADADGEEGDGPEAPGAAIDGDGGDEQAGEAGEPAAEDKPDLAALRAEYFKLRDRLFRSRARAATAASAVFSSKLRIELGYDSGRFHSVTRTSIRLDGASVYEDVEGDIAEGVAPRFEGYVAPGRHVITMRVETISKEDDRFRSATENTFTVVAPAGKNLIVSAVAKDDGSAPYDWKKKESGSYKLRLDISLKTIERDNKSSGHIKRGAAPQRQPRKARSARL